jgi:predicted dehydrogenase
MFESLELLAISDIVLERAREKAAEHQIPKAYSVDDLLGDSEIELVINLTVPAVHAEVSRKALEAGKHVYSEKPLATKRADGQMLLEAAKASGKRLGCAPDTFLGGGIQTCRKLIDDGWIGRPIAASAFMAGHGVETWHPNPFFFFQYGGHPLFDMGPYYLTALINLLGPVASVVGLTQTGIHKRIVTSQPHAGAVITPEAPMHATALLKMHGGQAVTMIVSGEVLGSTLPRIEIYGDEGALSVPDPNTFGGPVRLLRKGQKDWQEMPLSHGYTANSRGLGAADLATAFASGRPHRASAELAYHVLDVQQSIQDASDARQFVDIASSCERPAALPLGLLEGQLDG